MLTDWIRGLFDLPPRKVNPQRPKVWIKFFDHDVRYVTAEMTPFGLIADCGYTGKYVLNSDGTISGRWSGTWKPDTVETPADCQHPAVTCTQCGRQWEGNSR